MKKLFLFITLAFIFLLSTCKREYIGDYDADYIGEWHSDTFTVASGEKQEIYLKINGKNSEFGFMCQINCAPCQCNQLITGKAVINSKHKVIIIGNFWGNKQSRIKIITPPYQNSSGKWLCVIKLSNNITLYKR